MAKTPFKSKRPRWQSRQAIHDNENRLRYETKVRILTRDKCICYLCNTLIASEETASIDHIVPRAQGGSDADSNLAAAHIFCNFAKQDLSLAEFRAIAAVWAGVRP